MIKKIMMTILILLFMIPVSLEAAGQIRVNYRLKWLFNVSVAGDIYADAGGYFSRAGLKVMVKEGSPEKNAINELELNRADFGVASADQIIRALDRGAHLLVLAQLFQINPMQWIYRTDHPEIKNLQDLKGRKIGITFGGNDETIMNTLLAAGGIQKDEVILTGVRFDFTPFLRKKVDVWPVYRNSQGVILKNKLFNAGEGVYFLNPADFGVNFVANSVITSEKIFKNHPDIVGKFLSALLKGWEAAMDPANENNILTAVKKLDRGHNDDIRKKQLKVTRTLIKPSASVKIGTIDTKAWQQTQDIMLKENQIKKPVNIKRYLIF